MGSIKSIHSQMSISDLLHIFHIDLENIYYLTYLLKKEKLFQSKENCKISNANSGIKFTHL